MESAMDSYLWLKYLHIVSAMVIFGTGLGTAFQMWMAHRSQNAAVISAVAHNVVWADWLFTTPAVIVQPISGVILAWMVGYGWNDRWLTASVALYVLAGACWLPVVWLQIRMRDLATEAALSRHPLPPTYQRCARWWFVLGWPAFGAVLVIIHLMIQRPIL